MRQILLAIVLTVAASAALAQALQLIVADTHQGGAAYTGILDVTSTGVQGHYGSVAGKSASRGLKMYNICDSSTSGGGTCKDINSDATTGKVSSTQGVGTIATCGTGGNQCYVNTAYDDSGAAAYGDVTNFGNPRPAFIVNAIGTLPGVGCLNSDGVLLKATAGTTSGPIYMGMTLNPTSTPTSRMIPFQMEGGGSGSFFDIHQSTATAGYLRLNTGFSFSFTFTGGQTFGVIAGDDGAANGHIFTDGTDHTGTVGTGATSAAGSTQYCGEGGGIDFVGFTTEFFFYHADISSSAAAMNTAMHTNNGF